MRHIGLFAAALFSPALAWAQTYPSPTFQDLTVLGSLTAPNAPLKIACGSDGTTKIQAALTAGGNVVLPACPATAPILISATLNIPSNTTLRGQSRESTWIKEADGASLIPLMQNTNAAGAVGAVLDTNIAIRDLSIEGNGANQAATLNQRCLRFLGVAGITISNVVVKDCRSDAVMLQGNSALAHPMFVDHLWINGTVGPASIHGWGLAIQNAARNIIVSDVFIENTADSGLFLDHSEGSYTNIHVKGAGFGSAGNAAGCTSASGGGVDSPPGAQFTWNPCPAGIYFHNVTNDAVANVTVTQNRYYGMLIVGARHTAISNVIATGNSLAVHGTWDDLHLDLNNGVGYGENHHLTITGAVLGANSQNLAHTTGTDPDTAQGPNSINPPTSRYGLFIADGMAGSVGDATIVNGGAGYALNNTLTCVGGTFTQPCKFVVNGATGGIVGSLTTQSNGGMGVYSALPANPVSLSGGSGTGAAVNIAWSSAYITGVLIGQAVTAPSRLPAFITGWVVNTVQ
jgi:hypothetical protein